jgi:hypothetical protein
MIYKTQKHKNRLQKVSQFRNLPAHDIFSTFLTFLCLVKPQWAPIKLPCGRYNGPIWAENFILFLRSKKEKGDYLLLWSGKPRIKSLSLTKFHLPRKLWLEPEDRKNNTEWKKIVSKENILFVLTCKESLSSDNTCRSWIQIPSLPRHIFISFERNFWLFFWWKDFSELNK